MQTDDPVLLGVQLLLLFLVGLGEIAGIQSAWVSALI
jgi:hypothetical protein